MVDRVAVGRTAEAAVADVFRSIGYEVINLNELVGNCPFADLIATKVGLRLLVQVKGTTTADGLFGTPPERVRALMAITEALDCLPIYAFCHLTGTDPVIRFADAATVATLAEADEAAYDGVNRYHVNIGQFPVDAKHVGQLLEGPSAVA
ncbi:hypothetical protein [Micromonospora sp. NPDC049033]|uniref:hypothetical protein n=1 Tax=Micromonospora sp. NPDC049033 TaxID=3155149 RepID=UPI0033CDC253